MRAAEEASFEKSYQPVITRRCLTCHGEQKPKAGLNLGRRERVLQADVETEEPVVVARRPDRSRLLQRVVDGSMPPEDEGPPLSEREISLLRAWIEAGADWPEGKVLKEPLPADADKPSSASKPKK